MPEKAYIRNQEVVLAVQFDGSAESMRELMDSYPDTFEIRKPCAGKERGKPSLIVKSGRNYAAVKKDDYIVFDSFGNAQVYRPEYFSALFRRADAPVPSYVLADAIFELSKGIGSEKPGKGCETLEYDELLEEEKEVYEKLASGLLRKFVIVPADESVSLEILARKVYDVCDKLACEEGAIDAHIEYDEHDERVREAYRKIAHGLLRKFTIVQRDEDLF